jgi:site-specific recombinase XerD
VGDPLFVVRLADGESGLSARTIARRLSSVSGFYAYVMARGDTALAANPVPRGLSTRRERGSKRSRTVPLVRVPRTLPKILAPGEVDALVGALRTQRDRAMVLAMVLGGLRRCEVLGLRLADLWVGERRLFIAEGKGGHQRVVPIADRFFAAVGDYLHDERPRPSATDRVFVVLKEGAPARPAVVDRWRRRDPHRRLPAGWPRGGDVSSAAPHLSDPVAGSGHGAGSRAGPGRSPRSCPAGWCRSAPM